MEVKRILVYGFARNEYCFMLPAIRYVLGSIKAERLSCLDQLRTSDTECDLICVNCAMSFYELALFFKVFSEKFKGKEKPLIFCLSWEGVPEENLNIMTENKADLILFDLRNEDEFAFCRKAYLEGKSFRSEGTYERSENFYCENLEIYEKLSKNQKYAFAYMMTGHTQKEFQVDFGYKSMNTACTHWHDVLRKFKVTSVCELRAKFR